MQVKINVFLKEGVLDPAGKATRHALSSLGFAGVKEAHLLLRIHLFLLAFLSFL